MKSRVLVSLATTLFAVQVGVPVASAQCFLPDGFAGPCNIGVTPTIPSPLPPVFLSGLAVEWDACSPISQTCVELNLGGLTPTPLCAEYTVPIDVSKCGGPIIMKGDAVLDFARTWKEVPDFSMPTTQVWRFNLKIDLFRTGAGGPSSPVPDCLATTNQAFYYGYVDYSRTCGSSTFESAVVLYHAADAYVHSPLLSSFPGNYHPTRSFALVAPHTTANPFDPAPPSGSGVLILSFWADQMRAIDAGIPGSCLASEDVTSGQLFPLAWGCTTPFSAPSWAQFAWQLKAAGSCGGTTSSMNLFPVTPWYGLIQTNLGHWTTSASYPGKEEVGVIEGLVLQETPTPTAALDQTFDVVYGSNTGLGYRTPDLELFTPAVYIVNLASNYSVKVGDPIPFPVLGQVGPSAHVLAVHGGY